MKNEQKTETWKKVNLDFEFTSNYELQVSNLGRIRTFSIFGSGRIVKGSRINGYKVLRLKFFRPRNEQAQKEFVERDSRIRLLADTLKNQQISKEKKTVIAETEKQLAAFKADRTIKYKEDLKSRTIYYHALFHRLVAEYFLPKPKKDQTVVSHVDYNKQNNDVSNLRWMTPDENHEHQQKNPVVIKQKEELKLRPKKTAEERLKDQLAFFKKREKMLKQEETKKQAKPSKSAKK